MPPLEKRRRIDSAGSTSLQRNRLRGGDELEQVAQLERLALVDELRKPLVVVPAGAVDRRAELVGGSPLQRGDDLRVRRMALAALAELHVPGVLELRRLRAGGLVPRANVALQLREPDRPDGRGRVREARAEHVVREPDRLEHFGAAVRVDVGDAHLRHHLEHAALDRAAETPLRLVRRRAAELVGSSEMRRRSRARGADTRRLLRSRASRQSGAPRAARRSRRRATSRCESPPRRGRGGLRRPRGARGEEGAPRRSPHRRAASRPRRRGQPRRRRRTACCKRTRGSRRETSRREPSGEATEAPTG